MGTTPGVPRARVESQGAAVHEAVTYAERRGYRPLLLDLHVPAGAGPVPVVVWIHGGAFWEGDRRYMPPTVAPGAVFDALTAAGLAVATVDYRLSGEASFPAQLDDVRAAVTFLTENADRYGLDPRRIGVWGESAGGTLAGLTALTHPGIGAAALWYAVNDLATPALADPARPEAVLFGDLPPDELRARTTEWSLENKVTPAAPPFLLVHGTADVPVPVSHSERLHARLEAAGVRSEYLPVQDAGHIFEGYDRIPELIGTTAAYLARELAAPAVRA
ncbi:alpha/beta hydrolase fold domain-containing protein [Streptomyces sp. NPDC049879]|uniref:alpha/beta hydrolase fold domain-containing protein n=1 Tax=Streptomyces sp. NPDC049879 TaxID=3365598 RepID=UPI0037BC0A80